jgi:hypothetical protein
MYQKSEHIADIDEIVVVRISPLDSLVNQIFDPLKREPAGGEDLLGGELTQCGMSAVEVKSSSHHCCLIVKLPADPRGLLPKT